MPGHLFYLHVWVRFEQRGYIIQLFWRLSHKSVKANGTMPRNSIMGKFGFDWLELKVIQQQGARKKSD